MSHSQPLSTEDLAGRQEVPAESPARDSAEPPDAAPDATGYGAAREGYDATPGPGTDEQAHPDARMTRADEPERSAEQDVSLVDAAQAGQFRDRWSGVQAQFVDDPRGAVGAADALVAELMQTLAAGFADHKSRLETQWQGGGEADTEELRLALRRYRVFFQRLLQT